MKKIIYSVVMCLFVTNSYGEDLYKNITDTIPKPVRADKELQDYYLRNVPQQIDCQEIQVDHREYKGKVQKRKICFYHVVIADRTLTMWSDIRTGEYGFVQ